MKRVNFVAYIFALGIIMLVMYVIAYFLPITNQAVVSNSSINVFAKNNGVVEQVLIKNGQYVNDGESILIIKNDAINNEYNVVKQQYAETTLLFSTIKARINTLNSNLYQANLQLNNFQKIFTNHVDREDLDYSDINKQIKTQQSIISELQKQLGINNIELVKVQTQLIEYNNKISIIKHKLDELVVKADNSGYIQYLDLLPGGTVTTNDKLFTLMSPTNQKVIAYFSENDLQKIHEGDDVLIFPRAYLGFHYEKGRVIAGNWSIPVGSDGITQNYLVNSPKRIPVEIEVTSDINRQYQLNSGMSAYVYIIRK